MYSVSDDPRPTLLLVGQSKGTAFKNQAQPRAKPISWRVKPWAGTNAIPGLVSRITVDSTRADSSSGGEVSIPSVSLMGFGADAMPLCDKGKGILEIDVDCSVDGGAVPKISLEDT